MLRSITDSVNNTKMKVIASELELWLGVTASGLVTRLTVMSKEELIEFANVLSVIQNYISSFQNGTEALDKDSENLSHDYRSILTTEEIEEMLEKLEAEAGLYT